MREPFDRSLCALGYFSDRPSQSTMSGASNRSPDRAVDRRTTVDRSNSEAVDRRVALDGRVHSIEERGVRCRVAAGRWRLYNKRAMSEPSRAAHTHTHPRSRIDRINQNQNTLTHKPQTSTKQRMDSSSSSSSATARTAVLGFAAGAASALLLARLAKVCTYVCVCLCVEFALERGELVCGMIDVLHTTA